MNAWTAPAGEVMFVDKRKSPSRTIALEEVLKYGAEV